VSHHLDDPISEGVEKVPCRDEFAYHCHRRDGTVFTATFPRETVCARLGVRPRGVLRALLPESDLVQAMRALVIEHESPRR
jgi:hypothetical protein